MIDLSCAIRDCGSRVEVTTFHQPEVYRGRKTGQHRSETRYIDAVVVPMKSSEVMRLPEGMRNQGTMKVFSEEELLSATTSRCSVPDRLNYDGREYVVQSVDNWSGTGNFYVSVVSQVHQ